MFTQVTTADTIWIAPLLALSCASRAAPAVMNRSHEISSGPLVVEATALPQSRTPEATCPLVLEREGPIAAAPAAGAWPPSFDPGGGGWAVWPDYRRSTRYPDPPHVFARGFGAPSHDVWLGDSTSRASILAQPDDSALVAVATVQRRIAVTEVRSGTATRIATVGTDADFPLLARSGPTTGLFWQHGLLRPILMFAADLGQPLQISVDAAPLTGKVRVVAVPGGFVAAWTQLDHEVWFARIVVEPGHAPQLAWRGWITSPTIWPAIDVEQLGELTMTDGELWLPILKAAQPGNIPDTHVLRVGLDGKDHGHVVLARAPFFAAVTSELGVTLSVLDDPSNQICIRRFGFDGRELTTPSCAALASTPDVAASEDNGYAWGNLMNVSASWRNGTLHVASLDNYDGTVKPTLRRFRCE